MRSPHRLCSKIWMLRSLLCIFLAFVVAGCSRKTAPKVETAPAPLETPAPPVVIEPEPAGPPAGSVWDVVTPDGRLPSDLLQSMAKAGADIAAREVRDWKTWPVDVNGDGSKEIFISNVPGWCGSGGCSVWLWQRTPAGLRNLLPTQSHLTLAIELGEPGPGGYHDILFYHRAMQGDGRQSLAQVRLQWNGKAYHDAAKIFLGDYLKTPLPAGAWRVNK
ncbi:MAG: hypothetical protein ONB41_11260 [candidate division KSB1 bacterium]|nr:hypothetical protein [candidate division KSB1 bacterium]